MKLRLSRAPRTLLRLSRAPWTLRRRLVVSVVALFALLSLIVGGFSVIALYGNLLTPIDNQLTRAVAFTERAAGLNPDAGPPTAGGNAPGLSAGSIVADSIGTEIGGEQSPIFGGTATTLSSTELTPLLSMTTSGTITNITIPGVGDFRVIRTRLLTATSQNTGATFKFYRYIATPLADTQSTMLRFGLALGGILLGAVLLVAFATRWIVALALRPLQRVAATATEVSSMPLDRGEVDLSVRVPDADTDQRTEVGQVGLALNTMLGHVGNALQARQASESRVRQFVADASHELRTPLASIRGYAELTRRGNYDLPEDVTHSLGRVESEAVRMTTLVEDLLLLARLDEGRDIETGPLDLSRLLVDCVSDAYAAGPEHEWELDAPDDPVKIEGDGQRIHQVFVNLLANARVHTPPGTTVTVALSQTKSKTAVVTVTDDGPGIPVGVRATLFERFARGDSSRSRASGSTGLGLAIVKAVIDAHGGSVTVASVPGKTEFRIELPVVAVRADGESVVLSQ
ncbi:MAG: two-component system, OmpR family, sensor kinase [Actinomycetota bacterium]|nr:two-component system, OmpR family, sensor kinase [Actinomycetota bacterium]MDQ1561278.1 two-component system, OmpR family, sensor kinase [Actinomycetota bacterium]